MKASVVLALTAALAAYASPVALGGPVSLVGWPGTSKNPH